MKKGGTPPLVPMWPHPQVRAVTHNPFPFFPFNPRWGEGLALLEHETFCMLLRLAWVSPRPCFLPSDPEELTSLLRPHMLRGCAALNERILSHFKKHADTGLLYFPPQLNFLARLVNGENMYALLWDER